MSRRILIDDDATQYENVNLRLKRLEQGGTPVYTTATKPSATAVPLGTIIFVSDGGAGNVFQGSNGTAWVGLG